MRYIIITNNQPVFYTEWFDLENNFDPDCGMIVIDLINNVFTKDGKEWVNIEFDHL